MTYRPIHPSARGSGDRSTRAFTLIELMISIAMVLILLIGVNSVFKMSADTVGSGMATSSGMRDIRAFRGALSIDLTQIAPSSAAPFLIIHQELGPAFLNKQDQLASGGGSIPTTIAGNEILVPDRHMHRRDVLQFFVSGGDYRRQTGTMTALTNPNSTFPLQSDLSSEDAWIWIGHLRLADNSQNVTQTANYAMPTAGTTATNANNLFANQFVLGRMRMLLSDKNASGVVTDSTGAVQWWADEVQNAPANTLQPLAWGSPINRGRNVAAVVGTATVPIQSSFTDVAGISLGEYRARVMTAFAALPANTAPANAARQMVYQNNAPVLPFSTYRFAAKPWLDKSIKYAGSGTTVNVAQNRLLQFETALEAPILLRGCSQFIVEYAGDYMQQNPTNGNWVATGANPTAPELDWNPVFSGSTVVGRKVRWYGMRRAANIPAGATTIVPDVLPLYWYLANANHNLSATPGTNPGSLSKSSNITPRASFERLDLLANSTPAANNFAYTCAWSPNDLAPVAGPNPVVSQAPWLIRITIRVDDPNGRLPDGQTMEFIYELPHAK